MAFRRALVFVLAALHIYAQSPLPTQFVSDFLGQKAGLPEEVIYSVTQTDSGYLWLATANGLVRYDGTSLRMFQPRTDLGGAAKQEITRLGPGPRNSLWVYSRNLGLLHFEDGKFRRAPEYPAPCRVEQILPDQESTLVVCWERLLRIEQDRVTELATRQQLFTANLRAAAVDDEGAIWMGSDDGKLVRLSSRGAVLASYGRAQGMPAGAVHSVITDRMNRVWIATHGGLGLIEQGRVKLFTTRHGLTSNLVGRLSRGRGDSLWVGTAKGLHLYENAQERLTPIRDLPAEGVQAIFGDREGNVWVTFYETCGIFQLREPKFVTWGAREGLLGKRPLAVLPDGDTVWIATAEGLQYLRGGAIQSVPLGRDSVSLLSLEIDGTGRLWALGLDEAFIVDRQSGRALPVKLPPDIGRMFTVNSDRQGRIWIIAETGLYLAHGLNLRAVPIDGLPELVNRSDLRQGRDGRLWLSVSKGGLFEIRDGQAVRQPLGSDPELDRIHTFYIDSNNDFWFGLDGGGLARWRNGVLARYGNGIGAPHNFVYHLAEDTQGYLWAGLRAGLLRIHKAELNAYLDGTRSGAPEETLYGRSDGLSSHNFGLAQRAVPNVEPSGILWFAHLKGVLRIDTQHIPMNRLAPPVHLLEVAADGRELPAGDTVQAPAGTDLLRFSFSVPSLVNADNVRIRYRLAPFDSSWRTNGTRSVTYSQVPPGEYTFSVSASNNDNVWNEKGVSIRVVVLPHFYQTLGFKVSVLALLAMAIVALFRWRIMLLRGEKVELERRVDERTAELAKAKQTAENAAQVKSEFLATMSHEIRTPMHGVLGNLELLSQTTLNTDQREYLDTVRNSSTSLLALLNEVLDLSKLEAGRMELRPSPFSLRRTVQEITQLLRAAADLKNVSIAMSYDGVPDCFNADEMRIRQILFNLAGNAVKFTDRGQVAIEVMGRPHASGSWELRMDVRDTGIGIPQDRLRDLFKTFSQVDSSNSRRHTGTGLGLAICQRLAAMMDGSIEVRTEFGKGSTFSLIVVLPEAAKPQATVEPSGDLPARDRFTGHCLVADDNAVNRRVAKALLERLGCTVTLAGNGREAVELATKSRFPLIFMDCQMPEMDGFEATKQIRSRLGWEPVIVAMTANALPGDRDRCLDVGMNDYIAKPFQLSDLVRTLNRYMPAAITEETPAA